MDLHSAKKGNIRTGKKSTYHSTYKHEEIRLLKIISQLNYTGKIPTGTKAKDSLDKLRKLITSLERKNKTIRQIQSFDKKIDVTVNFNEYHLKQILKFLKYQKNIKYKLIKAEVEQKFGKLIIKKYQVKVNEIKYDYNKKFDFDKAMSILKEVEEKILNSDLEETISFQLVHRQNYYSKMLKICKFLLKSDQQVSGSKIRKEFKINTNLMTTILYDLFGKSLVVGVRGLDENGKDFDYYWIPTTELLPYIDKLKKIIQKEIAIENEDIERFIEFSDSGSAKF